MSCELPRYTAVLNIETAIDNFNVFIGNAFKVLLSFYKFYQFARFNFKCLILVLGLTVMLRNLNLSFSANSFFTVALMMHRPTLIAYWFRKRKEQFSK